MTQDVSTEAVTETALKVANPQNWGKYIELAIPFLMNLLVVAIILIVGFWLAGMVKKLIMKVGDSNPKLDKTLFQFLGSVARYAILAFTTLMVLGRFGVETTSIVALIGAAGLAVGLALQGALSNLAAGVMLLIFRPFNVGDFIDGADVFGKVTDMNLFTTEIGTFDNQHIIVPNSLLWGAKLINHSHYPHRGVDMKFGVAYGADLGKARTAIMGVLDSHPLVLSDPAPFVEIETLNESSVDFLVRPFCKGENYFDVRYSLPEQIKKAFDAAGVEIPYPHRKIFVENIDS